MTSPVIAITDTDNARRIIANTVGYTDTIYSTDHGHRFDFAIYMRPNAGVHTHVIHRFGGHVIGNDHADHDTIDAAIDYVNDTVSPV